VNIVVVLSGLITPKELPWYPTAILKVLSPNVAELNVFVVDKIGTCVKANPIAPALRVITATSIPCAPVELKAVLRGAGDPIKGAVALRSSVVKM
jgi:hypothetical protein